MVIGSSNTDMVIRVRDLPRPGETVLGGKYLTAAGGKGANQAVAAARAGGRVRFVARVGQDTMGQQAIAGCRAAGVDVRHVSRDPRAASGAALIFVSRKGENCIAVAGGANEFLTPAHVRKAQRLIANANVLLLQLETPLETVEAAARLGITSGATVILNPAPARTLPARLLRHISILTPNESEAELLTGMRIRTVRDAATAAAKLRGLGVRTVVITLGARGAYISGPDGEALAPGFRVKPVDTTAAGDVFNGALAVAITEEWAFKGAIRFAHAAAALSVTRHGAQPSAPTRRAIDQFLKTHGS